MRFGRNGHVEPGGSEKFAALYGKRKQPWQSRPGTSYSPRAQKVPKTSKLALQRTEKPDEDVPENVRLHKSRRERELEAIERERRLWKRYLANRQSRLDKLASEVPGVAKFLKALARIEPKATATAYRDIDFDLAELARRHAVADVPRDYDRFTVYEEAYLLVQRVARRQRKFTEPDEAEFFTQSSLTTLDELKQELRLK